MNVRPRPDAYSRLWAGSKLGEEKATLGRGRQVLMIRKQIVVVGAGFGGIAAVKALKRADAEVTLIDRTNHHLFQPLLYQVATAALSPADIASASRALLRRQKNVAVLWAKWSASMSRIAECGS